MIRRFISTLTTLVLLSLAGARAVRAQPIHMTISGPGATVAPIAVSEFKNLGGDDQGTTSHGFVRILRRDLELSGFFSIISPKSYIEDPQNSGYDLGKFNFGDWSSLNADFLVKGAVTVSGGQVSIEALMFDVAQQRRMFGTRFSGGPGDVEEMARRFADSVLKAVTGIQGPFDTRIAFVSTRGGRFKEIYLAAPDGGGLFRVTDNPTINLFPKLARSAASVLYLSYKTGAPALFLFDVAGRTEVRVGSPHGNVIGGALSPDGSRIVAAVENGGHTNLFLLDRSGEEIRQLTEGGAINVNPAFSADGRQLAFTSDRSGTPQIYVMSLGGGAARRVTFQGDYNTSPSFSPDGKWLAYQSRSGGFNIFIVPAAGGRPTQLTQDARSNQSPCWSPDGRYLIFSSSRGGHERLYLMQVNTQSQTGKVISALMEDEGNDTSPTWSWWLGG
ncbi:MAG TPA: Tol-Pal system beta propeller repeat protein TolB [Candidatus Binataceae bacterium]|jgi:TolB protein|nr:Tol-Pal system beta propeller repeat protein TolB [Candidatus Binataceae bacterium]